MKDTIRPLLLKRILTCGVVIVFAVTLNGDAPLDLPRLSGRTTEPSAGTARPSTSRAGRPSTSLTHCDATELSAGTVPVGIPVSVISPVRSQLSVLTTKAEPSRGRASLASADRASSPASPRSRSNVSTAQSFTSAMDVPGSTSWNWSVRSVFQISRNRRAG